MTAAAIVLRVYLILLLGYMNVFTYYYGKDDKKPIQNVGGMVRVFTAVVLLVMWFIPITWLYVLFFIPLVLLGALAHFMSYIHYYNSLVRDTYLTSALTIWGLAVFILGLFVWRSLT